MLKVRGRLDLREEPLEAVAAFQGCVQAGDGFGHGVSSESEDQTRGNILPARVGAQGRRR